MAVSAYLLMTFESEQPEVRRAGFIYLVLTHLATLALLAMFAAWNAADPATTFTALAERARSGAVPTGLVLALATAAFAVKAGVVPLHFWLPGAHAAAPSHVSALLSGVMIKTGVYGLLRVAALLGAPPAWWGWMLLLLGLASAVLGVLWALGQHDLKRLLAYHSVENIGIILLGLGMGVLGTAYGHPGAAALGYSGALLHTLNHALFKSLLFLGAGAVGRATGTREIDRLGGLAGAMPRTAAAFLVGSLAIVGLPPFNGFVSEWVVFQGLLDGARSEPALRSVALGAAGLALTGALALACFAKLYGTVFLGHPRDRSVDVPAGIERPFELPQIFLASACVLIGLVPLLAVVPASRVSAAAFGTPDITADLMPSLLPLAGMGLVLILGVAWLSRAWRRRVRRAGAPSEPTWGCGYPATSSRMQYTATSFASPLLRAFGPLAAVHEERTPSGIRVHPFDLVLDQLGRPLWRWVQGASTRLRVLQAGRMRWYLAYLVLTLIALLVYLGTVAPR
jgi:formate hydrogenlyase subunit 3/multisubunit Na+/H+ antiporter MnhD subunit